MALPILTQEFVREILHYDPLTGIFIWKERPRSMFKSNRTYLNWNGRYPGNIAGSPSHGYLAIAVHHIKYAAHRLAWLYVHGEIPCMLDHINHDRTDNRIANLRPASNAINGKNRGMRSDNTSGVTGVAWSKACKAWRAYVQQAGEMIHLGVYKNLQDAIRVREAAMKHYDYHPNHGNN